MSQTSVQQVSGGSGCPDLSGGWKLLQESLPICSPSMETRRTRWVGVSSASSLGGGLVTSLREAQLWAKASDMGEVGLQWRRPSRLSPECGHVFIVL